MVSVTCKVHTLAKDKNGQLKREIRVVRIRATAFQAFPNERFIIQIKNAKSKLAYFEAQYADDAYIDEWQKNTGKIIIGNDLIFMSEPCRKLLNVKPGDTVDLERIQGNDLPSLYAVHTALSDDSNEGWIWIRPSSQNTDLQGEIENKRSIVRIKINSSTQNADLWKEIENKGGITHRRKKLAKPLYAEALLADIHYLERWRENMGIKFGDDYNVIFISAWYRNLLCIGGIGTPMIIDLSLESRKSGSLRELWALLYQYPRNHPQVVVRTANMLAIIGFGLGVIGIGLGLFSIDLPVTHILGIVSCVIGLGFSILGFTGLIFRR